VPPPQRGDGVDVEEAAAGGGDAEEIDECESDPNSGIFGDEGGDFQMRFLVLEERKHQRELEMMRLEEQKMQREEQNQMEQLRLEEQRKLREIEQMKWKEELELKMMEKTSRESPAVHASVISGDALRNTISRMSTEGIDVVS